MKKIAILSSAAVLTAILGFTTLAKDHPAKPAGKQVIGIRKTLPQAEVLISKEIGTWD
ncbi:hypothetical protein [Hufsiella ginkgonis]|uniref:Uncharacterized protein n=1 Tax=Hufsiella ginkgonis TaxID=2695274 RepID=A0A7K1XXV6_9SPHI|nr:hypothetical protein [Hufsiella ginkgonis]MXV15569.1 hypothetical protein [Hufsiella ginkgonis]